MPQQKVTIKIPKSYSPTERKAISQEIIDFIVERTQKGFDKDGKQFKGYSKSYKNSLDFKLGGKTSKVDLTLTEEMLGSLTELSDRSGSITIGYEADDAALNGKVEGNRKGTYGQKKPVTKPRDFLGLSPTALKNILSRYPQGDSESRRLKRQEQTDLTLNSRSKANELNAGTDITEDDQLDQ